MSTQIVQHKSRDFDVVLNFPSTENTLSWAFAAENDGEIYAVDLVNVASYQIAGAPATLPYAVTAGASYAVSIVKQTNGQPATISFSTRRAVNKTVSISVSDFGQYSGRYLYVLKNNNVVDKYDTELLKSSNWLGGEGYIVNPLVSTITLPALPNSAVYTGIIFVKNNNQEKLFVIGGEPNSFKWYASYILMSDDSVFNLDFSVQNSYTQIFNSSLIYNSPKNIVYDYVSEILYIKSTLGDNGVSVLEFRLNTLTAINLGYSSFADRYMQSEYTNQYQFSPIDMQFISVGDSSLINSRNYNYKIFQNNGNVWAYRFRDNTRLCTGESFGRIQVFNLEGNRIATYQFTISSVYSCFDIKCFDRANKVFLTHINRYSINDFTTLTSKIGITSLALPTPNNYIANLTNSHYSGLFFAFACTSGRILSTRMIIFDDSLTQADFAYIDFSTPIYGACTNQLIV